MHYFINLIDVNQPIFGGGHQILLLLVEAHGSYFAIVPIVHLDGEIFLRVINMSHFDLNILVADDHELSAR